MALTLAQKKWAVGGSIYDWNEKSTYIRKPTFFDKKHPRSEEHDEHKRGGDRGENERGEYGRKKHHHHRGHKHE